MTWQLPFYGLTYKRLQRKTGFPYKPWNVVSVLSDTLHAGIGLCPCSVLSQAAFTSDCKNPNISNDSLDNPVQIQLMQRWRKVQGVKRTEVSWISNSGAGNVQTSGFPKSLHFQSQPGICSSTGPVQHCSKTFICTLSLSLVHGVPEFHWIRVFIY